MRYKGEDDIVSLCKRESERDFVIAEVMEWEYIE
jgi:hypothetical protein